MPCFFCYNREKPKGNNMNLNFYKKFTKMMKTKTFHETKLALNIGDELASDMLKRYENGRKNARLHN